MTQYLDKTGLTRYDSKIKEFKFKNDIYEFNDIAMMAIKILEENEYTPKVVKKYMLDITSFIVDENLKSFYDYCIDCFLLNMEGKSFTLTDEIIENQVDISLVQSLMMLNALKKEENISNLDCK